MLLTTLTQKSISSVKETLDTQLPLEKYGDIGDYYEFQFNGAYYFNLKVENSDLMTLFLVSLDNNTMEEIELKDGNNKLFLDLPGDNECLMLVGNSQNKSVSSVEQIDKYQTKNPPSKLNVSSIGDVNVDLPNNRFTISTNRGNGITTVSNFFFGDRKYLTNYNENFLQASGVSLQNLEAGIYSLKIEQFKSDIKRNDLLLAYNGKNLVNLAESNLSEIQNSEIEIPYGLLYLIACDTVTTSGATEFSVTNLMKSKDLDYIPPKQLPLTFQYSLGRVSSNKNEAIISTGTGSRSFKTIVDELNLGNQPAIIGKNFTEGGYGTWELENGKYRLTYQLKTSDKVNLDSCFLKNNGELVKLVSADKATIQYSKSQNISEQFVTEVDVNDGTLTALNLDSGDKKGSSEVKFTLLELLSLSPTPEPKPDYSYYDLDFNLLLIQYTLPQATSTIEFDFDGNIRPFDGDENLVSFSVNGDKISAVIESAIDDKLKINLGSNYSQGSLLELIINNISSTSINDDADKTVDVKFDNDTAIEDVLTAMPQNSFTPSKAEYTNNSMTIEFDVDLKKIKQEIKTIYIDCDGETKPFIQDTTVDNGTILAISEDSLLIRVDDNNDGKFSFTLNNINSTKIADDKAIDIGINSNDLDFSTDYPNYIRLYSSNLLTLNQGEQINYLIDTTESLNTANVNFQFSELETKKSFNLRLEENSFIDLALNIPLIIEFVKDKKVAYSTEYADKLKLDLMAGEYQLNFFTEGGGEAVNLNISAIGGFDMYKPINSEPTNPQPKTLRKLGNSKENAFYFGTLIPWENDSDNNSGKTWNHGYIYQSAHLGHSNIQSSIMQGKDEICCFEIPENCYLNLYHNDASVIIESAESREIIGRNDSENGQLQIELTAGKYYLQMSSMSDEPMDYNISIYLSVNDPNYSD